MCVPRDFSRHATPIGKRFRRKFRVPKAIVDGIVQRAQSVPKWTDKPAGPGHGRGGSRHPLVMKVLAALRRLAKGDDYESLEDASQLSETLLKSFIPEFIKWFKDTYYPEEVKLPTGPLTDHPKSAHSRVLCFPAVPCCLSVREL